MLSVTPRPSTSACSCSATTAVVELTVVDDGRGFTFDQAAGGLGLAGMRERALLVNGDLRVESRPGDGTRVRLRVPIEVADGADRGGR